MKPPIKTDDVSKRVKRLAAPRPGVVIVIPLELLPAYFDLYGIEPAGYNRQLGSVIVRKKKESRGRDA